MKLRIWTILYFSFCFWGETIAQKYTFQDSLRGAFHENRSNNDLLHYHLKIKVDPVTRFISGFNKITCKSISASRTIQVDLVQSFDILQINTENGPAKWKRSGNSVEVTLPFLPKKDEKFWVQIFYQGHPHPASNAPWEGGFVWEKDKDGLPWIGVACEGEGSSLWFPSKDHPADEADSVLLQYEVPRNLTAVGNGQFLKKETVSDSTVLFTYKVTYPINHYNITFNAGFYKTWTDTMVLPEKGQILKMSFFALTEAFDEAKNQWKQAKTVIKEFSKLFGDYPFIKDGYKLVHTPYLGMEHQSCIAYGDKFENNAFDFDFILLHETGHEWWGNQISASDHADMWIHESFCTYSEALFVEKIYGKEKSIAYLLLQKKKIKNRSPIQGPKDVYFNAWKDSDMYYKGTWLLHSLRQVVDNDSLWFAWLHSFRDQFGMKPISTKQVVEYSSTFFKINLNAFFNQYLHQTEWPQLQIRQGNVEGKSVLEYRWNCKETDFLYPVDILINQKKERITPTSNWTKIEIPNSSIIAPFDAGMLIDWKNIK